MPGEIEPKWHRDLLPGATSAVIRRSPGKYFACFRFTAEVACVGRSLAKEPSEAKRQRFKPPPHRRGAKPPRVPYEGAVVAIDDCTVIGLFC